MSDKPVAAFKNYGKKGSIAPVDLEVRPGEMVGLAGLLGSGRTKTAEVIFGIKPADSGTALIKGKPQTLRLPHQASVLGIGFCRKTGKPMASSLPPRAEMSSSLSRPSAVATTHSIKTARNCRTLYRQLGIRTPSTEQPIETLSGGNGRKYCFHVGTHSSAISDSSMSQPVALMLVPTPTSSA
ncbi:ATP-binding cassette domain-containing protein [Shigella flexneri]